MATQSIKRRNSISSSDYAALTQETKSKTTIKKDTDTRVAPQTNELRNSKYTHVENLSKGDCIGDVAFFFKLLQPFTVRYD